jgi:hypothetical protein
MTEIGKYAMYCLQLWYVAAFLVSKAYLQVFYFKSKLTIFL